jgi:hypothetical protein
VSTNRFETFTIHDSANSEITFQTFPERVISATDSDLRPIPVLRIIKELIDPVNGENRQYATDITAEDLHEFRVWLDDVLYEAPTRSSKSLRTVSADAFQEQGGKPHPDTIELAQQASFAAYGSDEKEAGGLFLAEEFRQCLHDYPPHHPEIGTQVLIVATSELAVITGAQAGEWLLQIPDGSQPSGSRFERRHNEALIYQALNPADNSVYWLGVAPPPEDVQPTEPPTAEPESAPEQPVKRKRRNKQQKAYDDAWEARDRVATTTYDSHESAKAAYDAADEAYRAALHALREKDPNDERIKALESGAVKPSGTELTANAEAKAADPAAYLAAQHVPAGSEERRAALAAEPSFAQENPHFQQGQQLQAAQAQEAPANNDPVWNGSNWVTADGTQYLDSVTGTWHPIDGQPAQVPIAPQTMAFDFATCLHQSTDGRQCTQPQGHENDRPHTYPPADSPGTPITGQLFSEPAGGATVQPSNVIPMPVAPGAPWGAPS